MASENAEIAMGFFRDGFSREPLETYLTVVRWPSTSIL